MPKKRSNKTDSSNGSKQQTIKKWISYTIVGLGIISVLLGIVARFSLWGTSFEWDEVFTAVTANPAVPFTYILKHYLIVDVHPPLYNLFLWIYMHIMPYGPEWALRLPSIFFSLLALGYGWWKFPRCFGRNARWVYILLFITNAWVLFFSQYARAYAWMLFLSTILTFSFVRISHAVRHKQPIKNKEWWIFAISSLLLCWSHYFGAFLFGLLSVALFLQAIFYRRPLKMFICVPLGVFLLFLPWLIPNLMHNLQAHRFAGNWWANLRALDHNSLRLMLEFLFGFKETYRMLLVILGSALVWNIWTAVRKKPVPYRRDILWLSGVFLVALVSTWFVSHKIYWFLGRYFVPFMPAIFLVVALLLAPLIRRTHKLLLLVFFFYVFSGFYAYYMEVHVHVRNAEWWVVREAMEWYQQHFPDKELYVVSIEAFPQESLVPMYSYYPNVVLKMNTKVTELFRLPPPLREAELAHQETALTWMPNCEQRKLKHLAKMWHAPVTVLHQQRTSCFLVVGARKGQKGERVLQMYQRRLKRNLGENAR